MSPHTQPDPLRWISPFDPRGMTILGALGVAMLSVGLWSVNGTLPEVWPNRCSLFKEQLTREMMTREAASLTQEQSDAASHHTSSAQASIDSTQIGSSPLSIVAEQGTDQPTVGLWSIGEQSARSLVLPVREYVEARISAQPLAPVWVELITRQGERVVAHLRVDTQPLEIYDHLIGASEMRWVSSAERGSSPVDQSASAQRDDALQSDPQALWESALRRRALTLTPDAVTCAPKDARDEVLDVLALTLKRAEHGLRRAWLIDEHIHLTEHHIGAQIQRRVHRVVSAPRSSARLNEVSGAKDQHYASSASRWMWTWRWTHRPAPTPASTSESPPLWVNELIKDLDVFTRSREAREALTRSPEPLVVRAGAPLSSHLSALKRREVQDDQER